jgi:membrane dipeptidase
MTSEHFERLRRGGIHGVNYTTVQITSDFNRAALEIRALIRTIERYSDQTMLIKQGADILQARSVAKIGLTIGLQNGRPLMEDLAYVEILHALGVRVIQLTYNERNLLGDGCIAAANGGLSRFGRCVVRGMNRCGVLVDISQGGERTTLDAIEVSEAPIVVSHANAFALCPSPRNKSDEILKMLAERGGVIGAVFWGPITYIDPDRRPGMEEFLNHVDCLVEHAGLDHVGIGSD